MPCKTSHIKIAIFVYKVVENGANLSSVCQRNRIKRNTSGEANKEHFVCRTSDTTAATPKKIDISLTKLNKLFNLR